MLLIGFGVSFFETDPILICVYTICIAFLLSIVIPIIIDNLKNMIKITGKNYEAYVNKNKMINMYYDKNRKTIYLRTESNSDEKAYNEFKYENVEEISEL